MAAEPPNLSDLDPFEEFVETRLRAGVDIAPFMTAAAFGAGGSSSHHEKRGVYIVKRVEVEDGGGDSKEGIWSDNDLDISMRL